MITAEQITEAHRSAGIDPRRHRQTQSSLRRDDMITKAQARSLAIRYHAYMEARLADDYMGVLVWGPMLEEIQKQVDYEMVKNIPEAVQFARLQVKQAA